MLKEKILFSLVPSLSWIIIHFLGRTIRWKIIGEENVKTIKVAGGNVIYAFWHDRILLTVYFLRNKNIQVLISASRDGEYLSRTARLFGAFPVRGSSSRQGIRGFLKLVKKLKSGYDGAITPDGPQGPPRKVQLGTLRLAEKAGIPIIPITYGVKKKKLLKSWDSFVVPYPFTRGVFIYGAPLKISPGSTDLELKEKGRELEESLNAITQEADEYFK